jgi:hypothetical protein
LELVPLLLIVRVLEPARIGALARRLDLDEADQRLADSDGKIGPGFQIGKGCLADEIDGFRRQAVDRSQVLHE